MLQIKTKKNPVFTRIIVIVLLTALIVLLCIAVKPAYDRYIENDHVQTCHKARFVLIDRYNHALEDSAGPGTDKEQTDYEAVLEKVLDTIQEDFPYTIIKKDVKDKGAYEKTDKKVEEVYVIENYCRSGGTDTIVIDPVSHEPDITCSVHGRYE